jgi:hypothetical protein
MLKVHLQLLEIAVLFSLQVCVLSTLSRSQLNRFTQFSKRTLKYGAVVLVLVVGHFIRTLVF